MWSTASHQLKVSCGHWNNRLSSFSAAQCISRSVHMMEEAVLCLKGGWWVQHETRGLGHQQQHPHKSDCVNSRDRDRNVLYVTSFCIGIWDRHLLRLVYYCRWMAVACDWWWWGCESQVEVSLALSPSSHLKCKLESPPSLSWIVVTYAKLWHRINNNCYDDDVFV